MGITADAILNADDTYCERVDVPVDGWRELDIYVRRISGAQRDHFEASLLDKTGAPTKLENARARFAALVLCDEKGQNLFTEHNAGALGHKSAQALEYICEQGRRVNGMADDSVEELEKNSEAAPSGASGSSSPSPSVVPFENSSTD